MRSGVSLAVLLVLMNGCAAFHKSSPEHPSTPTPQGTPVPTANTDHHGYALLYDLMGDEKDVSKLHFIKHERPELQALLEEVATACREAHAKLEQLGKTNRQINLKDRGLPVAETETRKTIASFRQKAALSSKDKDLELEMLLDQNEALTYGAHLAGTIARLETDAQRQQLLQQMSARLSALGQKIFAFLQKNYSWTETK